MNIKTVALHYLCVWAVLVVVPNHCLGSVNQGERANLASLFPSLLAALAAGGNYSTSSTSQPTTTPKHDGHRSSSSTVPSSSTVSTINLEEKVLMKNESSTPVSPLLNESTVDLLGMNLISSSSTGNETVFIIRQPNGGGSVAGILKEAVGLVSNTIRSVGLNIGLLGSQLLLGTTGGGLVGLQRLNSTHLKVIVQRGRITLGGSGGGRGEE